MKIHDIHNSSTSSFDPFEFLRTHTSTVDNYSYFPLFIPFVIVIIVFIIAWVISKRRKKED